MIQYNNNEYFAYFFIYYLEEYSSTFYTVIKLQDNMLQKRIGFDSAIKTTLKIAYKENLFINLQKIK